MRPLFIYYCFVECVGNYFVRLNTGHCVCDNPSDDLFIFYLYDLIYKNTSPEKILLSYSSKISDLRRQKTFYEHTLQLIESQINLYVIGINHKLVINKSVQKLRDFLKFKYSIIKRSEMPIINAIIKLSSERKEGFNIVILARILRYFVDAILKNNVLMKDEKCLFMLIIDRIYDGNYLKLGSLNENRYIKESEILNNEILQDMSMVEFGKHLHKNNFEDTYYINLNIMIPAFRIFLQKFEKEIILCNRNYNTKASKFGYYEKTTNKLNILMKASFNENDVHDWDTGDSSNWKTTLTKNPVFYIQNHKDIDIEHFFYLLISYYSDNHRITKIFTSLYKDIYACIYNEFTEFLYGRKINSSPLSKRPMIAGRNKQIYIYIL